MFAFWIWRLVFVARDELIRGASPGYVFILTHSLRGSGRIRHLEITKLMRPLLPGYL